MPIDFSKLSGANPANTALAPREIFSVLPRKVKKYQYLRDVQAEVLRDWFARRPEKDIVLKMNTGGGKTVVGLLIMKSCLNEGFGPAVYVTPDIYLAQQVVKEAEELGIEVTQETDSPRFRRSQAILVTHIHKVINGKSVFGVGDEGSKIKIGSMVVDDAHACLSTTEGQFTLTADAGHNLYTELFTLFKDDLYNQSKPGAMEVEAQDPAKNMLVPYWSWIDKTNQVAQSLYKSRTDDKIMFVWPLIKDVLPFCQCVFGGGQVEISTRILPIHVIPSFMSAQRRIFMTATLADDSILVSHFDTEPRAVQTAITPSSANDIGDRLILIPEELNPNISESELKSFFQKLSVQHNVVVIVPSYHRAQYWSDIAQLTLHAGNLHSGVQQLKEGHVGLVILVNKYDGVDLPYSACRILVIDGLPDVRRRIDKLEQIALDGSDELLAQLIQRLEQGMGRGVRANDDYCVIFLTGKSLTHRLYIQGAITKLTTATRAQYELSEQLAEQIRGKGLTEIEEVVGYVLNRDPQWVALSKGALVNVKYSPTTEVSPIALKQREALRAALIHDYNTAANAIQEVINDIHDLRVKGWLKQQLAEYIHFTDKAESQKILKSAVSDNRFVIHPLDGIQYSKLPPTDMDQAKRCAEYLLVNFKDPNKLVIAVNSLLENLVFRTEIAPIFEQATKDLAFFIGYVGQRPEAEFNKGPDVLWEVGQLKYFVIECKNGATSSSISKADSNQLSGSMNWFTSTYDNTCKGHPILIHPFKEVERSASPISEMRVITSEKLDALKDNLRNFFRAVASSQYSGSVVTIAGLLRNHHLTADRFIDKYTSVHKKQL